MTHIGLHAFLQASAIWNRRAPDLNRERQCAPLDALAALDGRGAPTTAQPHGCICPSGAEAGCKGAMCPRKAMEYRT